MTITLNLAPETERKIHEHAVARGQTVEGFICGLLEEVSMMMEFTQPPRRNARNP
jgi:hypothetical protein